MKSETYKSLLKDLQKLQKTLVASQIAAVRASPELRARLLRQHQEAEVGGQPEDYIATAARRSTVLFLLRTVFVRVLEDLHILDVRRIGAEWGFAAFREVAPTLGWRAYLDFVFRDLGVDFPALFRPDETELPLPDEDGCQAVRRLWQHPNKDGERYVWEGGGFDSRFLGDLYQDLDADIRKRFALLQTPRFVEEYILDHTLTPALAEFDPAALRAAGRTFRLLDPTCGSGHFLIGGFHRLADYWRDQHGLEEWPACERALESIWGCDINPHAVDIAEFRLLLELMARTGVQDLHQIAKVKLNLLALDSLIPWEHGVQQGELFPARDLLDTYATRTQRRENTTFLAGDFHAVAGNPPYIRPVDKKKVQDYKAFWPKSAAGLYALSAPFAERFFDLAVRRGFVGQITANNFTKRSFGRSLITKVFSKLDITDIVDTSGAFIPGHATPTLLIFGRNGPPVDPTIRAVLGKRGEPARPTVPERGLVWSEIVTAGTNPTNEGRFVSVAHLERTVLSQHPWSLGGGVALDVLEAICERHPSKLESMQARIGNTTQLKADEIYLEPAPEVRGDRYISFIELVQGEAIRDWATTAGKRILYPYTNGTRELVRLPTIAPTYRYLWRFRELLFRRPGIGFKTVRERGLEFYEYPIYTPSVVLGQAIAFAFVCTHNQFSYQNGGRTYNRTSPVIRLGPTATEADYQHLTGLLNSSTLGFWMKQVFHNKGASSGGAIRSEDWESFWEYDSTKIQQAPLTDGDRGSRVDLARALTTKGNERTECLPARLLASKAWSPASLSVALQVAEERYLKLTHQMVALQEELDWLTYGSYGLTGPTETVRAVEAEPLAPGHRPFEIVLAQRDEEAEDDEKSSWWSRHGHERTVEIPVSYSDAHRRRIQQRVEIIESDPRIALLESPPYKRRWQLAHWTTEAHKAAESWLLDRLDDLFAPATDTTPRGVLADPKPYRLEEIVAAWSRDPRVAAVAGVWTGTGSSVDLTVVVEKLLRAQALPDNPNRVYTAEGMLKLDEWKRVWALQDQEDAWEAGLVAARDQGAPPPPKSLVDPADGRTELTEIPLPRKFEKTDFLKGDHFSIRGKLNVPRERFILFADLSPARFGWNGWRDTERAIAQAEAFTLAESDPHAPQPTPTVEDPRRCGATYGLWESLPDVRRWGGAEALGDLLPLAQEACRQPRCPCPVVEAWRSRQLDRVVEAAEPRAGSRKAAVTLAERAWLATLLAEGDGTEMDLWARHQNRTTGALPGIGAPIEVAKFDINRMKRILDDLVASGDAQMAGRGGKRRYTFVPRGVTS